MDIPGHGSSKAFGRRVVAGVVARRADRKPIFGVRVRKVAESGAADGADSRVGNSLLRDGRAGASGLYTVVCRAHMLGSESGRVGGGMR